MLKSDTVADDDDIKQYVPTTSTSSNVSVTYIGNDEEHPCLSNPSSTTATTATTRRAGIILHDAERTSTKGVHCHHYHQQQPKVYHAS